MAGQSGGSASVSSQPAREPRQRENVPARTHEGSHQGTSPSPEPASLVFTAVSKSPAAESTAAVSLFGLLAGSCSLAAPARCGAADHEGTVTPVKIQLDLIYPPALLK